MGEYSLHRLAFHGVVVGGGGAMQVQVIDLISADPGCRQCFAHGRLGTKAIGLRCGNMVSI